MSVLVDPLKRKSNDFNKVADETFSLNKEKNEEVSIFASEDYEQKESTFDSSTLDSKEWDSIEPKQERALGFLWNTGGYTYTTSNGVKISLDNIEDVEIFENKETGEVIVIGANGASIKSGSKDASITIYDSEIEEIETGKGNDNLKIFNSEIKNISTGKGIDNVEIKNSDVENINTGSGNDTINIKDSTISQANTSSSAFFGLFDDAEDTVMMTNSQADKIKTGKGDDNIITDNSQVQTLKTGSGSDALSLDETVIDNLKTNKKDTTVENGNYLNIDKSKIANIESDVQLQISETESVSLTDYTDYLLNQPVGFETEEEYQQYVLEALTNNLETMKSTFQTQEDADGILSDGYNALKDLTGLGISDKDVQAMIAQQEEMVNGLNAALNGESNMSFEEAYEYYTGVSYSKEQIDKYMEVSNTYSAMMVGCQYDEDYMEKFEAATGKSVEDVTKEYALCQMETFGKSTGIQDLVDKYSQDQEGFADKLSSIITTSGIALIAVGAIVSFVFPPAAPVGAALMTAGKYISLGGMFVDNAMDLVDDSTDKDGLTKEELGEIALETGVEAVSYGVGRGIGKLTQGINSSVTNKFIDKGVSNLSSKVIGQAAETTSDMTLSLVADYGITQGQSLITTGQFMDADDYWSMDRFLGEGKNQLLGILTGISAEKVNAYQKGVISAAQAKILSGDADGARTVLVDSGMKLNDDSFNAFVKEVEANRPQVDTEIPKSPGLSETTTTKNLEDSPTIKAEETDATRSIENNSTIKQEEVPNTTTKESILVNNNGKTTFIDPITKTSFEVLEIDTTTGVYKYNDNDGTLCEYRPNDGVISKYKMQGKPGQQVLTLSSQVVLDADNKPIETRKKIKTDKNGNILSYKTYDFESQKIIDTREFYSNGTLSKKEIYDNTDNPKVIQEIKYREDGSLRTVIDMKNGNKAVETEYRENGTSVLFKKEYGGVGYTKYDYDESGKVKTEGQYTTSNQKVSSKDIEYNENGNVKQETIYDAKNQKVSTNEYEYNSSQRQISKTETTFENGKKVASNRFEYDEQGNVIKTTKIEYNPDGSIKTQTDVDSAIKVTAASLSTKIQGQLSATTSEEVIQMIDTLRNNGATTEEATAALQVLTQFGNVESFANALKDPNLGIGIFKTRYTDTFGNEKTIEQVCANTALNYFCSNKGQISLQGTKQGFVLDEHGLRYLESLSPQELEIFTKDGNIQFINFEGWNTGTTIFGQGGSSDTMLSNASKYIEQARTIQASKNISFEEAFKQAINSETIERAKKLGIVDVKTVSASQPSSTDAVGNIVKNLSPYMKSEISEESIKEKVDLMSKALYSTPEEQAQAADLIIKYLDSQTDVYSFQRLGNQMVKIQSQIESFAQKQGVSVNDIYYLVPFSGKSYEQVLLQYMTVNGIDNDHIIYKNAEQVDTDPTLPTGRIYVAFDDVVGSGLSMLTQYNGVHYTNIKNNSSNHFVLAPIISASDGANEIKKTISSKGRQGQDLFLLDNSNLKNVYTETTFYKSLSAKEQIMLDEIIKATGGEGLGQALSIMFPYMAPDNNSYLSSFFFEDLYLEPSACMKSHYKSSGKEEIYKKIKNMKNLKS